MVLIDGQVLSKGFYGVLSNIDDHLYREVVMGSIQRAKLVEAASQRLEKERIAFYDYLAELTNADFVAESGIARGEMERRKLVLESRQAEYDKEFKMYIQDLHEENIRESQRISAESQKLTASSLRWSKIAAAAVIAYAVATGVQIYFSIIWHVPANVPILVRLIR